MLNASTPLTFLLLPPVSLVLATVLLEVFVLRRRDREAEPGVLWLLFCAVCAATLAGTAGFAWHLWKKDPAWLTPSFWMFGTAAAGSLAWLLKREGRNRDLLALDERFYGPNPTDPPQRKPGQAFWILSWRATLAAAVLTAAGPLVFSNPSHPAPDAVAKTETTPSPAREDGPPAGTPEPGAMALNAKSAPPVAETVRPPELAPELIDPTKAETPPAELSAEAQRLADEAASMQPANPETEMASGPGAGDEESPTTQTASAPEMAAATPVVTPPVVQTRPVSRNSAYFLKIRPILAKHCVSCHGATKQKGDLALHNPDAIRAGVNGKPVIIPGNAAKSRLHVVTGLPAGDPDKMPPKGPPLNPSERKLLEDWINAGADLGDGVSLPSGGGGTFVVDVIAQNLAAPDKTLLEQLKSEHVIVRELSQNGRVLELDFSHSDRADGDLKLEQLAPMALNIYALDLGRTRVTDDDLAKLAPMRNLSRLLLNRTQISDAGLARLKANPALEHLNLYSTQVTDAGLEHLAEMPALRKVYLWQTKVTPEGVKRLQKEAPELTVNAGE